MKWKFFNSTLLTKSLKNLTLNILTQWNLVQWLKSIVLTVVKTPSNNL